MSKEDYEKDIKELKIQIKNASEDKSDTTMNK